jgi:endonuclease-3
LIKRKTVTFFNNKAKAIIAAAKIVEGTFKGKVPKTVEELITLPGVAYKTANVRTAKQCVARVWR